MEFNDMSSGENFKLESFLSSQNGGNITQQEIKARYGTFFIRINDFKLYCSGLRKNQLDNRIFIDLYNKFLEAFKNWFKFLESDGTVKFYIGRAYDALYLGIWDFDYVNDPNGILTPFGPYLFQFLEVAKHRRIGIIHACEQQQNHANSEQLIGAQLLANEIFNTFFSNLNKKPYFPVVQFSAGGPAAFFRTPKAPTIITLGIATSSKLEEYSALPHECGHAIFGSIIGRDLLKSIEKEVLNRLKKKYDKKNTYLKDTIIPLYEKYWKWWIEECFADAIAVAVLGEAEIVSLTHLFRRLHIDRIYRNHNYLRADEHPNRYIRVLIVIEVALILGLPKNICVYFKNSWENYINNRKGGNLKGIIRDDFQRENIPLNLFENDISIVAEALVNTEYSELSDGNRGRSVKQVFQNFRKSENSSSKAPKYNAFTFLDNLIEAIFQKKRTVIK